MVPELRRGPATRDTDWLLKALSATPLACLAGATWSEVTLEYRRHECGASSHQVMLRLEPKGAWLRADAKEWVELSGSDARRFLLEVGRTLREADGVGCAGETSYAVITWWCDDAGSRARYTAPAAPGECANSTLSVPERVQAIATWWASAHPAAR